MPNPTAASKSRTTTSWMRNGDDTTSKSRRSIERVVVHNLLPGTTVEELQRAIEEDWRLNSLIKVYQLSSRGREDSISFAIHLRCTDEANKVIDKFNDPKLKCDGRRLRAERVSSSPRASSSEGSEVQSSSTTSAGSRKAAARTPSPTVTRETSLPPRPPSQLPPRPSGGNAGSATGHVNTLTRIDSNDHRIDTEQSAKANRQSGRGRNSLDIRGRNAKGGKSGRPYSRGAVGVKPDFLEIRPRTPLLILAPPTKRSPTGDNDEDDRQPPVGVDGGSPRQDESVVAGTLKPIVSASTPPQAKEKLTLEERITRALSDFGLSFIRDPVSTAIQGNIGSEMQESAIPVKNTAGSIGQGQNSASNTNESAITSSVRAPTNIAIEGGKKRVTQDSATPTVITLGSVGEARTSGTDTRDLASKGNQGCSPGFVPGPAASISRVRGKKATLKAEARPFSPSTTGASRAGRTTDMNKVIALTMPGIQERSARMSSPKPSELYSWITSSAGAYPDSSRLYAPVSHAFYGPVGHLRQHIGITPERSPFIESIQTPGVAAAQASSALRATAGSFVSSANANHKTNNRLTPASSRAVHNAQEGHASLAVSLRPAASAFIPSSSYTNSRTSVPYNPLAEPFTPGTPIYRNTSHQSLRPFPAYFPPEFVNLLSQAGFHSVEDARRTLRNLNIVFKSVEGLAVLAPDVLHCFVLEFSMASKLGRLLDFPPFNSSTTATRQLPLEMAELTSVSIYCDSTCLEVLQWAGLNFVQEAEELLNVPESVPIFVERLAQRRPDAFTTFRDTFDLRIRLDEMLGYA